MRKNVAGQIVGAQINSKTDGSPVTSGTTTVFVTGDGGAQATGSVGAGACTHEGHGFYTYAPAQAETNFDHVAFTFENSSGVNATVQIYPSFPQTGDNFARLGAPAGASVSADIAAVKAETAGIASGMNTRIPAALVGGRMDSSVGAMAANVITAAAIDADAITDAKVASDVTIASVTGSVGSVTGAVGSVTGAVGSIGTGGIAAASFAAGAIDAAAIAANAIGASELATDAVAEIADAVWDELLSGHAVSGSTGEALSAAGTAGDPWTTALPGAYGAGTAGKIVGDNLNATVSSRATQTSVDTIDDFLDTEVAAIKTKTDFLPSATAGAAGGVFIAGSNAATSITTALTANIIGNVTGNLSGSVGSVTGAVGSVTGAVGSVTGAVGSVTGNVGGNVVGSVASVTAAVTVGTINANVITAASINADAITAAKIADGAIDANTFAAGAINAAAIAADAITAAKVADGTIDAATFAAGAINAAAIAADAITDAKVAADVTIASVTGSVGSVTGAVGSVTGAVGSVTGNVGGNVTGSVGSVAAGGITAASFAANAINAAKLDPDVTTELQAGLATSSAVSTLQTSVDDLPTNAELATALGTADDAVLAQVALVKAKTDNLPSDPADASDIAAAFGTVNGTLATIAAFVDTEVSAIKTVTDKLDDTLELGVGSPTYYRFTTGALELAPTGGSAPTVGQIADAVWDEAIAGHLGAGSTGLALNSASSAGDPWATALPGAYGAGTAGKIVGDNINATVSSRATQTSVDDLPTNAELATALGTADDAVLAAVATAQTSINDLPTNAELATALGTADDAVLAQVALVKGVTDKLDTTMELAGSPARSRFTTDALALAPTGGSAPSAAVIADAVWDEARAGHVAGGSFGEGVASVQGNVTGSVGSVTGAVGSVTGNVGGNVVGTVASVTGAVGSVTGNVGGNVVGTVASVVGAVGSVTAGVIVTTNNDKTGYRLSATGVDDVWDEAIAGHLTAGTTGKALNDATSAGNPWSSTLEGVLTAGDMMRIVTGVAVGKTDIVDNGNGTAHVEFRDASDLSLIVAADMTGSERTTVTLTP